MREVAPEFSHINDVGSRWSTGSTSAEWLRNTFCEDYASAIQSTVYVSSNPFTSSALDDAPSFRELDEVWRYGFDPDLGTIPPRPVNRVGRAGRELYPEQLIGHYMQPHHPFVADDAPLREQSSISDVVGKHRGEEWEWSPGDIHDNNVWLKYGRGEISYDELWISYRYTLEMVLEELMYCCQISMVTP